MDESIAANLWRVRERMAAAARRSGRDENAVTLIAATKGATPEQIRLAVAAGATVLGENRVQEALPKIQAVGGSVRWHLIGHLQRNKARSSVGMFEMIHSVDRLDLACEINRRAARAVLRQRVLIQVNVGREPGKHGVSPEGLDGLIRESAELPNLSPEGLMGIPPQSDDPEKSRPYFRWMAEKSREWQRRGMPLRELSMGMSNDFEIAIEEGATLIRVGTAIFGPREK